LQVDRIARQGVESGAWSVDRYLDIAQWSVTLDLRSARVDRAEIRIGELAMLEPRPHQQLAGLLLEVGRYRAAVGGFVQADVAYRAALGELDAAGEEDTVLAYVIHHDLGLSAEQQGNYAIAVERLEQAEAGKVRLLGATASDTLTTSLTLAHAMAAQDLDAALRLLDGLEERLQGAPDEQAARVPQARPLMWLSAARVAEADKRWDDARRDYKIALDMVEERGDEGSRYLRYILMQDLGDVAAAEEDVDGAIGYLEEAFSGKAEIRGVSNYGTMSTLERLVEETAKTNVDKALERITGAR
jgi:tetratricopeptide (TPR) repeat protein